MRTVVPMKGVYALLEAANCQVQHFENRLLVFIPGQDSRLPAVLQPLAIHFWDRATIETNSQGRAIRCSFAYGSPFQVLFHCVLSLAVLIGQNGSLTTAQLFLCLFFINLPLPLMSWLAVRKLRQLIFAQLD